LQLRGVRPFLSNKFDITKHKNYRYLSDANPKYAFNIGKYVSTKLKVNPDEEYQYFECEASDEEMPEEALGDFGNFDSEDLEPV
jgi:type IV secretion system protein VirD4